MSNKIVCPFCKAEYEGAEIFFPKIFFGNPDIIRNEDNTIKSVTGEIADMHEEYICDFCNNAFQVEAEVNYITKPLTHKDKSIEQ